MLRLILSFILLTAVSLSQDFDFFEPVTAIGGYGEMHYNNSKNGSADPSASLDFHRFVIFISHIKDTTKFNICQISAKIRAQNKCFLMK